MKINALLLKHETGTEPENGNLMHGKNPLEIILQAAKTYNPDILLAPEFFLYSGGKPYSRKEKKEIEKMIAGAAGAEGRLIIPGTIIWKGFWAVYNTAPIINGANITEYHKTTDGGTTDISGRYGLKLKFGKDNGRIFKWRNMDLGLEICADHSAGNLKKRKTNADIQIIIGCGAMIYDDKAIAKDNGYVLLCDGLLHIKTEVTSNNAQKQNKDGIRKIKPIIETNTEELYELEF